MAWLDEQNQIDNDLKFDDDFVTSGQLPDSKVYLARLESKLARLKDQDRVSPQQILKNLRQAREFYMNQLLGRTNAPRTMDFEHTGEETRGGGLMTNVERHLFPERTAMSAEELQRLLEADLLAKNTEQVQEASTEDMNVGR